MKMVTKNVKLSYLIKKLEEIKISYDFQQENVRTVGKFDENILFLFSENYCYIFEQENIKFSHLQPVSANQALVDVQIIDKNYFITLSNKCVYKKFGKLLKGPIYIRG